jgi:2'-5' RNA ligase
MVVRLASIIVAGLILSATSIVRPFVAHADVDQAKATGGIVALYLRDVDAHALAIPGGAPPEELHLTLVSYGPDVRGLPETELRQRLSDTVADHGPIKAEVFGHGVFNPNSAPRGVSTVYIVGDSPELVSLRQQVLSLSQQLIEVPPQHEPWVPHVTAAYRALDTDLTYIGMVEFDRIGLSWAGDTTYWPL